MIIMASSSSLLCEEQLQCAICLDVFTDPVSTPCGHNFCMSCLRECWNNSSYCQCPVCKQDFDKRPELRVNTFISGLAVQFRKLVQVKSSSRAEQLGFAGTKVLCDCCTGEKLEALKSCLDCGVSYCNTHLMPHTSATKLKKHKLIDAVEKLKDYICQKHERPLELFCRDDQMCVCQFCTEGDHKTHSTVPIEEESQAKKSLLGMAQAKGQQIIQDRMRKIEEIKHSVKLHKRNTEKQKVDSMKMFDDLMRCVERNQAELLEEMKEKQRAAEWQAEEFIKELEEEITELKRRDTELEQLSHTDDHLHFLQMYSSMCSPKHIKNWTDIRFNPEMSGETLMRALSKLQEYLSKEMEKLAEMKLKKIQQYAVDVTLDPDTVHPYLILSEDRKQVTCGDCVQSYPDNPERFNRCPCVLGKEGFSSGRSYYEVQVRGKSMWDLGVARESIIRKGKITACPENGYWSLCLRHETDYKACESRWISLSLKQKPEKIAVFVDYEEGLVSFYDVNTKTCIYSFTGQSFSEKLYPYFSPCLSDKGQNSAPLIISSVKQSA
ncbi:E3 ubiquitin-protein ligase TRIM39 isoform X2 [Ictalurus punctatus]|uniref:E3 ubiquitin-protein ligase TRIM39 isoform X2 n=1 Tax=Ictalurus punctatus TaxID=7998 RepID=A0A9F7TF70_ICTPU|nr:E3 ubiquitin-protein ligase TRIM39 isoform X2 [Ictalurus punctatus]